jgi:NodT family efflux transporter outer membrane factor (OMF) lipoprotein
LLSIFLSGCGVGPDYNRPADPKTKKYTKEDNLLSQEQYIVIGKKLQNDWWTLFESKELDAVIEQSLQSNYELAAAKKVLAQAEESVKSASGALLPQVGITALAGNQLYGVALFGPSPITIPAFAYYELGPTATWQLDLFGSTRYSIKQQEALALYQGYKLDAAYINLTSNVVAQALEIAAANAEIAATEQIIAEDEKTLHLVTTKFNVGSATKLDILNAQAQLDNDRAKLPAVKQRLKIAQHALAILVGKAPAEWQAPNFQLSDFKIPKEIPVSLPSDLVHRRPDIQAAEANLQSSSAAVGLATANMYPNIVLSADILQEALSVRNLFKPGATAWAVAATVTAPIFSGGTLSAEKTKAEYAYEANLDQYQQIVLNAFGQVADALTALKQDADTVQAEQQALNAADTSLRLAYKSYEVGSIGLLQVQDSARNFAIAQVGFVQAQRQRYLDLAKLFMSLGGSPLSTAQSMPHCK